MVLTFIKEILFALLLIVSIIVPPIYLGYQITPEFRKKRYVVYLLMMQAIAGKTFFEIMYLEVLIFFYLIFYMDRKKKGESLFLSLYLFSFYQSIRYLLVLFYIRMLDIDMLSEVGNGIVNSSFSLLALVLTVVMMKRCSLDLDLFFSDAFKTHYYKSFFIILPLTGFRIFSSFMTNINCSFYVRFDTTISLLIFIFFFSWLFYIKHLEQVYRDEQTIQRQEDENRSLQGMVDKLGNLYDEVRGFRHDFAGIVASMEPAIANQDMAEVSTIYQDVFLKTNEKLRKADYTAFNLHNIQDIAIRNTLAKAMIVADNQGIHFSLETVGVVEELALPMLEAIRILSILTTNALEAASEAENPQIRVALLASDRSVRFIIENTRKKEELNPIILSQKGYSTKGNHSGLGLATLEDMVFHYDLNLDTQLGETTFRQDLELPFKDEKRGGEE